MKFAITFLLITGFLFSQTSNIVLDEEFEDWNSITAFVEDSDDNLSEGVDFKKLWVTNNEKYLFFRIDFYKDIIIQEDSSTILLIDTDNNSMTGSPIYDVGAEIKYLFGKRLGYFYFGNDSLQIGQNDIKIISAPTVSSSSYEMKIDLDIVINNEDVFKENNIRVKFINYLHNLDEIPNGNNSFSYLLENNVETYFPEFAINKIDDSSIRLLSYNVHRDDIFREDLKPYFTRILRAINPEIIAFQEIYDNTSSDVADLIEEILPSAVGETWYHDKIAPVNSSPNNKTDEIIVSRYPIQESYRVQGLTFPDFGINQFNAAHLINITDHNKNILVVNAHPPCCSNYFLRGVELQEIMSFIRDVKSPGGNVTIDENTPIIIAGDMNLVGPHEERDILVFGDLLDNNTYGDDFNPDWDNTPFADAKPYVTGFPGVMTWYDESSSFSPGRLDYIIYSDYTLNLVNSYTLFTKTLSQDVLSEFNLQSQDANMASDHLPLVADFTFKDLVSIKDNIANLPSKVELFQNYPNPFNPTTIISFAIPIDSYITLTVYDILGQNVKALLNEKVSQGKHDIEFDASDLQSGIYYYTLKTDNYSVTKKLALVK